MLERGARALLPADVRNPAEWADKYRTLPASSAEAGVFRCSRTPYLVPVLEAYSDPTVRTIVFMSGSQLGKTDGLLLNIVGFRMSVLAKPVTLIFPSQHRRECGPCALAADAQEHTDAVGQGRQVALTFAHE